MERRRGISKIPAPSEGGIRTTWLETLTKATCQCAEIDCWSRSLSALSNLAVNSSTQETVTRVNRLINTWSADDALSTEGFEGIKANYKKLVSGLNEIKTQSDRDVKYTRVDMTS